MSIENFRDIWWFSLLIKAEEMNLNVKELFSLLSSMERIIGELSTKDKLREDIEYLYIMADICNYATNFILADNPGSEEKALSIVEEAIETFTRELRSKFKAKANIVKLRMALEDHKKWLDVNFKIATKLYDALTRIVHGL